MIFEIVKSNKKVELAKELIDELDDLYYDLTYDNDRMYQSENQNS